MTETKKSDSNIKHIVSKKTILSLTEKTSITRVAKEVVPNIQEHLDLFTEKLVSDSNTKSFFQPIKLELAQGILKVNRFQRWGVRQKLSEAEIAKIVEVQLRIWMASCEIMMLHAKRTTLQKEDFLAVLAISHTPHAYLAH